MKKVTSFLLFVVLLVSVLLYFKYDRKGYEYGYDCNFCNKKLPYYLTPQIDEYYSFDLLDEEGFELAGNGFRYQKTDFTIKKFLAYGYNDTSVVVKCTDSLNTVRYLTSYETGYKSKKGNPEISFKDLSISYFEQVKDKYQWIEIDEEKASTVSFMKFICLLVALLSLFFIIRKLLQLRKSKATD
jgi:hypothetical protein